MTQTIDLSYRAEILARLDLIEILSRQVKELVAKDVGKVLSVNVEHLQKIQEWEKEAEARGVKFYETQL